MTSKCVISLDLPEDIVAPLRDQFDLQIWSGKEAMLEAALLAAAANQPMRWETSTCCCSAILSSSHLRQ